MWVSSVLSAGVVAYIAYFVAIRMNETYDVPDDFFSNESFVWPCEGANYEVVTVNHDLEMRVVVSGPSNASNAILFLHGFPSSSSMWKEYIPYFANKGYRVIAPDLRGFNDSIPTSPRMSFEVLVEDMVGLLKKENRQEVIVVGHDWGTVVGLGLSILQPEMTKGFVSINVPHLELYRRHNLLGLPFTLRKTWYFLFFGLLTSVAHEALSARQWQWATWFLFGSANPKTFSKQELQAHKVFWSKSMGSMLRWYQMGAMWFLRGILPWQSNGFLASFWNDGVSPVVVPTLLLLGSHDIYVDPKMAGLSISREYTAHPVSRGVVMDATHWLPQEVPHLCIREMERFFEDAGIV